MFVMKIEHQWKQKKIKKHEKRVSITFDLLILNGFCDWKKKKKKYSAYLNMIHP